MNTNTTPCAVVGRDLHNTNGGQLAPVLPQQPGYVRPVRVNSYKREHIGRHRQPRLRGRRKPTHKLCLATWNVRTLKEDDLCCHTASSGKQEEIAEVFHRYGVNIACLQEVRRLGSGVEVIHRDRPSRQRWTLLHSGHKEKRIHGVGIVLDRRMENAWVAAGRQWWPVSPRIIAVKLRFRKHSKLTRTRGDTLNVLVISAYAPTTSYTRAAIEQFYEDLDSVLSNKGKNDLVLIGGDFNARIGDGYNEGSTEVRGPYGLGPPNTAGKRMLSFCGQEGLTDVGSRFRKRASQRGTWQNPKTKRWRTIDYILTDQKHRHWCTDCQVMRGAKADTDHAMIRCHLHIPGLSRFPSKQGERTQQPRHIASLSLPSIRAEFHRETERYLETTPTPTRSEERWARLVQAMSTAAEKSIPRPPRPPATWFESHRHILVPALLSKARAMIEAHKNPTAETWRRFRVAKAEAQQLVRRAKNKYMASLADEVEDARSRGRDPWRPLSKLFKALCPKRQPPVTDVRHPDGRKCETMDETLEVWHAHNERVLNVKSTTRAGPGRIWEDEMPECPERREMDTEPNEEEVEAAIGRLRNGSAPGKDGLHPEMFKNPSPELLRELTEVIQSIWRDGTVPDAWREAELVPLPKKGDLTQCDNWRGITLLDVASKIFTHILLGRLTKVAEEVLPDTQCGFRRGRSVTDMTFALRQLQDRAREHRRPFFTVFVDLRKAYDSVPREAMWAVLRQLGIPEKMVGLIQSFHDGMEVQVRVGAHHTEAVKVENGLRQGCVLSPLLFLLYSFAVVEDWRKRCQQHGTAADDTTEESQRGGVGGIAFHHKNGGGFPHSRMSRAAFKDAVEALIRELQYADDIALLARTQREAEIITKLYIETARDWGLTVSIKKTKIMGNLCQAKSFDVDGGTVEAVCSFVYLGSLMHEDCTSTHAIAARIKKASNSFGALQKPVFRNKSLSLPTKRKVFDAAVMASLLFGAESWCPSKTDVDALDVFHMRCIRNILRVSRFRQWQDRIRNDTLRDQVGSHPPSTRLPTLRLRWLGHVARMPPWRCPSQLLFSWHNEPRTSVRLLWKKKVQADMEDRDGPSPLKGEWWWAAHDRSSWREFASGRSSLPTAITDGHPLLEEEEADSRFLCVEWGLKANTTIPPWSERRYLVAEDRFECRFSGYDENSRHIERVTGTSVDVFISEAESFRCSTTSATALLPRLHLLTDADLKKTLSAITPAGRRPDKNGRVATMSTKGRKPTLVRRLGEELRHNPNPAKLLPPDILKKLCEV